jgi:site-specific recombinase XerD
MAARIGTSVATGPTIDELIPSFNRHLKATNKSPQTIYAYVGSAEMLARFLGERGMPAAVGSIRREHIESYVEHVLSTRKPTTASFRYRSLQSFFKWLVDEGEVEHDPMARMSPPIVPEVSVPVVSTEDLKRLLATCDTKTFEGRRDEAILRVFIATGARLAEVTNLRIGEDPDVDLDSGVIRVLGKGRRQRLLSIDPKTVKSIDRYIRLRAQHPQAKLPQLWLGVRGKGPMTPSGVRQMVWRRSEGSGIGRIHPHQLRHSFAHAWLTAGGSETGLMKATGWKTRAMLQRYASSTAEQRALEEARRLGLGDRL